MRWVPVLPLAELPVGQTRSVELEGQPVLLCRVTESEIFAVSDVCSHDEAPLGEGILDGKVVECPRHGARFDVTSGAVIRLPAAVGLETYPVRLGENDTIEVSLEEER